MITPDRTRARHLLNRVVDGGYQRLVRPALFRSGGGDPEVVHERMIAALGRVPAPAVGLSGRLLVGSAEPVTVSGIEFDRRVGLAAGLDKNGIAARAWGAMGFGFAELGTVTPLAQPGNERPRLFRLPESRAIINRMGFNNDGAPALVQRLQGWGAERGNRALGIPLGISIGKNKATALEEAERDYLSAFDAVAPVADYVAINVSSPNTPGLRSLQGGAELSGLIAAVVRRAAERDPDRPIPVWVKLAPDLEPSALEECVAVCESAGASAIIATNTTLRRTGVASPELHIAQQTGGLSGAPLTELARDRVARVAAQTSLPVIGVGGIMSADDARAMVDAGASLVQLYTGFIYSGPGLVGRVGEALAAQSRPTSPA